MTGETSPWGPSGPGNKHSNGTDGLAPVPKKGAMSHGEPIHPPSDFP